MFSAQKQYWIRIKKTIQDNKINSFEETTLKNDFAGPKIINADNKLLEWRRNSGLKVFVLSFTLWCIFLRNRKTDGPNFAC